VLDNKHPGPDGEEGLCDVRVIKAIEKSDPHRQSRTGRTSPAHETPRARPGAEIASEQPPELIDAKPADTTSSG